ncbi:hypothetical protein J6590_064984 [Homalodisca vitripennis]|nr:hypothetical protein J6590_064984 [Homalodisca vitripennis]
MLQFHETPHQKKAPAWQKGRKHESNPNRKSCQFSNEVCSQDEKESQMIGNGVREAVQQMRELGSTCCISPEDLRISKRDKEIRLRADPESTRAFCTPSPTSLVVGRLGGQFLLIVQPEQQPPLSANNGNCHQVLSPISSSKGPCVDYWNLN